ncbi:MAG: hypothetical protein QM723_30600 [Myxococcaceae bacterium]
MALLVLVLLGQLPECELPKRTTHVTMRQPLSLPDGTKFGVLAPKACFSDPTEVTTSATIDRGGSARATFESCGFAVSSVFTPRLLFPKSGFPIPNRNVEFSAAQCRELTLMPPVELPSEETVLELPCGHHFELREDWVQCPTAIDLYVGDARTRRELVGAIDADTAIIKVDEFSGWTQVSPFDPIPFRLNDGWYWWVHTADLKGCRRPRD